MLQATLQQFYADRQAPPEIPRARRLPEAADSEASLTLRAGRRTAWRYRGAARNEGCWIWRRAMRRRRISRGSFSEGTSHYEGLDTLRVVLGLRGAARRIECFDISTIQGTDRQRRWSSARNGRMNRSEFRKYRLRESGIRGGGGQPNARRRRAAGISTISRR